MTAITGIITGIQSGAYNFRENIRASLEKNDFDF
jgi:hypothetical protein